MQSLREYVIKSDFDFSETFTTEAGTTLFASKRFTGEKLSNKIATIVTGPLLNDGEILQTGFQVAIDPSCFFQQHYNTTGDQDGPLVINRREGLYRLDPNMIVLYRENEASPWQGYGRSLLIEKVTETEKEKTEGSLIVTLNETTEQYFVRYTNDDVADELEAGCEVRINKNVAIPYWFENKEYFWVKNEDVLAKIG